jgi:preprotein translocase subunit SecY
VGQLLANSATEDPANVAIYGVAFYLTTLGIIYVQEAERRIPINYSSRWVPLSLSLRMPALGSTRSS